VDAFLGKEGQGTMPELIQIQTYMTCNPRTYISVIRKYRDTLERLGCVDQQVLAWLDQIRWPISEDDAFGDIYASSFELAPDKAETIICAGMDVSLYVRSAALRTGEQPSWVGFNLLFESETLLGEDGVTYRSDSGRIVWQIMSELASDFLELGVYLTDEWQENRAWRTLVEGVGDPWVFDLAIFPRSLSDHFEEVPTGFQGTVIERGFGFALANRWSTLPWAQETMPHQGQARR
jgi:hypothetical protein